MTTIGGAAALSLAKNLAGVRATPYRNTNFMVEIESIVLGGFSEVSGLSAETEVETIREGGVNYTEYKLVSQTTFSDITLKNGLAEYNILWPWYQTVIDGDIEKRSGTIYMLDQENLPVMWWNLVNVWPKSWQGPNFDANSAGIAIQELVLVHEGLSEPFLSKTMGGARGAASVAGQL